MDHDTSHRHVVEVFSAGWNRRNIYEESKYSPVISVEYLEPVDGNYAVTWLEMQRRLPEGMRKYIFVKHKTDFYKKRFFSTGRVPVPMSRTKCLCQFINYVWWWNSLPIGSGRIIYPLFRSPETSNGNFSCPICFYIGVMLRMFNVYL